MNPFTILPGKVPTEYIPYAAENMEIISTFDNPNPSTQAFIITGIRGCGKTVFMTDIVNHYMDSKEFYTARLHSEADIYDSIIVQLSQHAELKKVMLSIAGTIGFSFGISGSLSIDKYSTPDKENLLRLLLQEAAKKKKKVLICIDEVSSTPQIKGFLASFQTFVGENLPIFLLMTGLPENIYKTQNSKNFTFLARVPKITLTGLNVITVSEEYKRIFQCGSKQATKLATLTKGYAYAYQLLGYVVWPRKEELKDEEISAETLRLYDQKLREGAYQIIWDNLSPKEREVVHAIAVTDGTTKSVREMCDMPSNELSVFYDRLTSKGVIEMKTYGRREFTLPRFGEFVVLMMNLI